MPFPTVDGVSAIDDFKTVLRFVHETAFWAPSVQAAVARLEQSIDAVSTQLYDDVQKLKALAAAHGWEIETSDPSQAPIS